VKMKSICSSETLVGFERTTRRYILEDSTLQRVMTVQFFDVSRMEISFQLIFSPNKI
jgi:hypothetical protein